MEFPEFWSTIEKAFSIDPNGINDIKSVLTLLKYTTVQSVQKFTNIKEIKLLEGEFLSRRSEFEKELPALGKFTFGSGAVHIIQDIALKVKKKFVNECCVVDVANIKAKVLADGLQVILSKFSCSICNDETCDLVEYLKINSPSIYLLFTKIVSTTK